MIILHKKRLGSWYLVPRNFGSNDQYFGHRCRRGTSWFTLTSFYFWRIHNGDSFLFRPEDKGIVSEIIIFIIWRRKTNNKNKNKERERGRGREPIRNNKKKWLLSTMVHKQNYHNWHSVYVRSIVTRFLALRNERRTFRTRVRWNVVVTLFTLSWDETSYCSRTRKRAAQHSRIAICLRANLTPDNLKVTFSLSNVCKCAKVRLNDKVQKQER